MYNYWAKVTLIVVSIFIISLFGVACGQKETTNNISQSTNSTESKKNESTKEKNEYTVGVQDFEEYLPESTYKNGEYSGFARELLDLFASKNGYKFVYKPLSINRLYSEFLEGNVDFKYPDNEYWSKDLKEGKNVVYSSPAVNYVDGVMVLEKNKDITVENLKKMGIVMGFTPFAYMDKINAGQIEKIENPNYDGLMQQVLEGRVDGAYSNIAITKYYFEKNSNQKEKLVFASNLPYTKSTRKFSSIKHPEVIVKFDAFLESNKAEVEALKEKYKIEDGIKDIK